MNDNDDEETRGTTNPVFRGRSKDHSLGCRVRIIKYVRGIPGTLTGTRRVSAILGGPAFTFVGDLERG